MEFDFLSRTEMILKKDGLVKLQNSHVGIFGVGGIGSCVAEMLCRAGVGKLTLIDGDKVVLSNLNRQLHSLRSNLDLPKTEAITQRLFMINPNLKISPIQKYIKSKEEFQTILKSDQFQCIVDSIDTLTSKCHLIESAVKLQIPIITAFGAGGRMDPTMVKIADISNTHHCRLAYYVRKKLHKVGIYKGVKTVFSSEIPDKSTVSLQDPVQGKKSTIGTISYMPNLFGCYVTSEVIHTILRT